jgi:hypothetical protein
MGTLAAQTDGARRLHAAPASSPTSPGPRGAKSSEGSHAYAHLAAHTRVKIDVLPDDIAWKASVHFAILRKLKGRR